MSQYRVNDNMDKNTHIAQAYRKALMRILENVQLSCILNYSTNELYMRRHMCSDQNVNKHIVCTTFKSISFVSLLIKDQD